MVYLDNAATSDPKPGEVIAAVVSALTVQNANPGRSGHTRALEAARIVLDGRERLAGLLGVSDPFSIIYCFNCTDALNLAIKGVLRRGDHVIASMIEHNSVLRVLTGLRDHADVDLSLIPVTHEGIVSLTALRAAVKPRTRLIILNQASNVTGAIQPVKDVGEFCEKNGLLFLVDGAQMLGSAPFRAEDFKCHLYAFPGHKGLLGPQGTGGLFIRPGLTLNTLREGGTGASSDSMSQNAEGPERYESGTLNLPGIAGLAAGTGYVAERLIEIHRHEQALISHLLEGLFAVPGTVVYGPRDASQRAGLVSFNLMDYASGAVADALGNRGFAVRGGLHCAPGAHIQMGTLARGAVRASVGHATTHAEIDQFLAAVYDLSKKGVFA